MGNAYWTCDMDSYSTDSLLWWHLMILINFDETHLSATIEHLFLVVKRVTCYFGQWEERQIFLSVTTDQRWKPNSRAKLIGWWEILSWICKNPCRMHYIVQLPHAFLHTRHPCCSTTTTHRYVQVFLNKSVHAWNPACHHVIFVKGTTVFNKNSMADIWKPGHGVAMGFLWETSKVESMKVLKVWGWGTVPPKASISTKELWCHCQGGW